MYVHGRVRTTPHACMLQTQTHTWRHLRRWMIIGRGQRAYQSWRLPSYGWHFHLASEGSWMCNSVVMCWSCTSIHNAHTLTVTCHSGCGCGLHLTNTTFDALTWHLETVAAHTDIRHLTMKTWCKACYMFLHSASYSPSSLILWEWRLATWRALTTHRCPSHLSFLDVLVYQCGVIYYTII